jgi:U3 small nucleolar RNA-associated protein 11
MLNNLKKYIPKRKFRERSQPEERKKKGFLEKKQDYKVRSIDYQKKRDRIEKLIDKARTKNPDEFYFQMSKDGIDEKKDAKSTQQYINLVNYKASTIKQKIENLENNLKLHGSDQTFKHKIFLDNLEEVDKFKADEYFNTPLVEDTSNRLTNSQLENYDFKLSSKTINADERNPYTDVLRGIHMKENYNTLTQISNTLNFKKEFLKPGKRKLEDSEGIYNYSFFRERKK